MITGKRNNSALLDEEDCNAINETLYLDSILGIREFMLEGMQENIGQTATELDW